MIEKHYGHCHGKNCKKRENVLIAYRWTSRDSALCVPCNHERIKAPKSFSVDRKTGKVEIAPHAGLKRTSINKAPSPALAEKRQDDWEVNYEIWDTRPHVCFECDKRLAIEPPPKIYFSHVLGKGPHPELRFDPENIVLHCPACHRKWETAGEEKREMKTYLLKRSYMALHTPLKD